MTDPGLPPKPRSLNLLESLVQEEEEKDKNKGLPKVTIPTSGLESSPTSDSQDNYEPQLNRENSSYKEFKMKDIAHTKGVKGNPNAGFKGKKFSKRRSRSTSSERGKKKGKLVRPFSADYKQEQRDRIISKNTRPKTSKGPRKPYKRTSSPKDNAKHERSRSPRSSSSDSYSDSFEEDKKDDKNKKVKDDFFDSDSSSKSDYSHDSRNKENVDENKNNKKPVERQRSESESSGDRNKPSTSKQANGHVSRKSERKQAKAKTIYKKKDGQQRVRSDSESSDYQRMVVVEDYSSFSSSEDESAVKEDKPKITNGTKAKPKNKKLLNRKKVLKTNTLVIDPDKYLEAKVHQKYIELEDLMTCSFVDQRQNVTRQQVYQMELLRDQYHNVSHGLPSSHVIIPRSLPGDVRIKGNRPPSGRRPHSARQAPQNLDSDQESYDRAYGTLRSVMDAEHARAVHGIRTDVIAVRDPPSSKKKPKKKQKHETATKTKDHSEDEDISEKPSLKSNTSSESTPRNKGPSIDHHIKYTKNEQLKQWLKEKNKIYRQHIKEEKIKKREERDRLINEANDKIEKRIESQKLVKKWMKEKNKELLRKHREEKKREEAEKAEQKKMQVNLPGDTMQIRPQSAPPSARPDDVKVDEQECKGEKTPSYVKDQIHMKREIMEENKQAKLAKQEPHPPQTKFIYKRPVAGKIKFKMQQDRAKSPHGDKSDGEQGGEGQEKGMRMSYDDWLKKKRRDDSAKRKEDMRNKELAKSDPELDRIIPALAKKRVESVLNSRKRVDTGIKQYDEKANKSFGGADFNGEEKTRPRSAYRLAGEKADGPALIVKQVRPQTAPSSRGKVPHPQKSVKSPRKAVIPQKPDAIMSNSDQSNPFKLPFPPEQGVPKYVAERQRKIFADQMNQRLAEAEQQEINEQEQKSEGAKTDEDVDSKMTEENNFTLKIEDTKQPSITDLMYSPKKREDSSESSSEEEENKKKKEQTDREKSEGTNDSKTETSALENKNTHIDKVIQEQSRSEDNKTDKQSALEEKEISISSSLKETDLSEDNKLKDDQVNSTKDDGSEEHNLKKVKAFDNLNDIGFGPPIIMSKDSSDDDESDSDNENVSMSNSGTTDSEKDTETEKSKASEETELTEKNNQGDDSHLVGILKDSKGSDNVPVPEKVEDKTFTESETRKDDKNDDNDDLNSPRDGASMRKRVSFNEQPTVYQSFESSSTDTVTPEQPGELNAEEFGLDAQGSVDDEEAPWPGQAGEKTEETLSFNIAGFELKPKVISTEGDNEKSDEKLEDKGATGTESQSAFITNPDKESEA